MLLFLNCSPSRHLRPSKRPFHQSYVYIEGGPLDVQNAVLLSSSALYFTSGVASCGVGACWTRTARGGFLGDI